MSDTHNPLVYCENCAGFVGVDEAGNGECRRNPPTVLQGIFPGTYPMVSIKLWCLDFQPNTVTLKKIQDMQNGRVLIPGSK